MVRQRLREEKAFSALPRERSVKRVGKSHTAKMSARHK